MIKVVHILDDIALGGVTRLLDALLAHIGEPFEQSFLELKTRLALPPRIDAQVIVVHFTMAWDKLPFLLALRQITAPAGDLD
jgi:hypothetical protein